MEIGRVGRVDREDDDEGGDGDGDVELKWLYSFVV
jgi:hypothetical protein